MTPLMQRAVVVSLTLFALSGVANSLQSNSHTQAAPLPAQTAASSSLAADALLSEAKARIHLKQYARAETALRGYLLQHPQSANGLYLLGYVLNREDRPKKSLEIMNRASAIATPAGDDLKIVALDYVLLGDYGDAAHWLEKAVAFDPKNVEAWYSLGRVYYTLQRYPEAKQAYLRVLQLDPGNTKAEDNLGLVYEIVANNGLAIQAYRTAIEWEQGKPNPSEQPYLNLGSLLLEQGKVSEAIPPLEQAAKLASNNPFCHAKLGHAYAVQGRLKMAKAEMERAISLAPDDAATHFQLARILQRMGLRAQAKVEFDRCKQLQGVH